MEDNTNQKPLQTSTQAVPEEPIQPVKPKIPTVEPQTQAVTPPPIEKPIMQEVPKPKSKVLPILITLLVIVLIFFLGYWAYKNYFFPQNETTSEETLTPEDTTEQSIQKENIYENQLAYISNWSLKGDGDLWLINPNNLERKLIINDKIDRIYNWSPDNKYIALSLVEMENSTHSKNTHAVIYIESSKITQLINTNCNPINSLLWISKDELTCPADNGEAVKILIADGSTKKFFNFPKLENWNLDFSYSSDFRWLAANNTGMGLSPEETNIYTYDITNNIFKKITEEGNSYFGTWREDKIIYYKEGLNINTIFEINPDGSGIKNITNYLEDYKIIYIDASENKILFNIVYDKGSEDNHKSKLFIYDLIKREIKEIYAIDGKSSPNIMINFPSISPNGRYVSFSLSTGNILIIDLDSNRISTVCEEHCTNPVWSN
ncbi:MAG: hypothetical protein ABIJ05_05310 [Patescibacteria group bacterium]